MSSLTEWVVLALLAEEPAHGFALARRLEPNTDLGRILTVRRPLVYRALGRLVDAGQARVDQREPGDAGPTRTVHRVTPSGRRAVDRWLVTSVEHVRDLRVEFLVKLRLTERRGRSPATLISAQRAGLVEAMERLTVLGPDADVVDRWRYHNARAVAAFLDDLDRTT